MLTRLPAGNHARVKALAKTCNVYAPNGSDHIIAWRENDQITGFAAWREVLDEAELLAIAVIPAMQGRGGGTALMQAVIDAWMAAGVQTAALEVRESNKAAQALYQKFGFQPAGRRENYYPKGNGFEHAVIMTRTSDIRRSNAVL